MPTIKVMDLMSKEVGEIELADSVFLPEHVGANNLGVALLGLLLAAIVGAIALGIGRLLRVGRDDTLGAGPAVVTTCTTLTVANIPNLPF